MKTRYRRPNKGFTLIELLFATAISSMTLFLSCLIWLKVGNFTNAHIRSNKLSIDQLYFHRLIQHDWENRIRSYPYLLGESQLTFICLKHSEELMLNENLRDLCLIRYRWESQTSQLIREIQLHPIFDSKTHESRFEHALQSFRPSTSNPLNLNISSLKISPNIMPKRGFSMVLNFEPNQKRPLQVIHFLP